MTFITLEQARQRTGHPTRAALDKWIRRFCGRYPGAEIRRTFGRVCAEDLDAALEIETTRRTPGLGITKPVTG